MKAMSRSLNLGGNLFQITAGNDNILRYKLEEQGKKLARKWVDFASSQTCSVCG